MGHVRAQMGYTSSAEQNKKQVPSDVVQSAWHVAISEVSLILHAVFIQV